MSELFDCRQAFAQALEELASADPRIVVVTNDSIGSSNITNFRKRFPERFVNVGIAEQNLIGVSAGLANGGKTPFVCGAACFLTGRSLEQVKVDLGYGRANVKLCGMSSGMAYGALGPTHHSIEDLAWTRVIPNLAIVVPADPEETRQAVHAIARTDGPVFLRVSRMPVPAVHPAGYQFQIGRAAVLREGTDVTLIANGTMVSRALAAAGMLGEEGIQARVLNLSTLKPLDREAVISAAGETGAIVTVEEHSIHGGLGSAVAEAVVSAAPAPMRILGVPGVFAPTGPTPWLFEHFGLTAQGIRDAARELVYGRVRDEAQTRTGD
ncbi:MAG: transketolase family protein [Bryobacterales bacterium]|nr:transketolase family protein [Bryobacterales bacterium]